MFRKDIQALRAFAVATVVAFHAGLPMFGAGFIGVDVFFVISGFLIIGLLTKEFERTGKIDLLTFLGRRSRRLIPAASVVLAVSALGILWFLPGPRGDAAFIDIAAASFYVANLRFASQAMDYWSPDTVSPIVHYWSLGVEEQFYVMFPIALVLVILFTRKSRVKIIELLLGLVVVVSFLVMMKQMSTGSAWGFYSPLGRAWEFAIGGLAATLGRPYVLRSDKAREILSWLSVGVLIYCVVFYDPRATFPGYSAIPPVVATALLLWNGATAFKAESRFAKIVSWRPFQSLGTWSYSTYLWHWPVLYFGAMAFQPEAKSAEELNAPIAIVLIVVSVVLAALTHKYVENPVRNHPALKVSAVKSLGVGLALSSAVSLFAIALSMTNFRHLSDRPIVAVPTPTVVEVKNSAAVEKIISKWSPKLSDSDVTPVTLDVVEAAIRDVPPTNRNGCHTEDGTKFLPEGCYFGKKSGDQLVVLFGNSHANQFFSGMNAATKDLGVKLLHRTRSGCSIANITTTRGGSPWDSCNKWRVAAVKEMVKLKPSAVVIVGGITVSGVTDPETGNAATSERKEELTIAGIKSTVKTLTDAGIKVLFVRNTPRLPADPVDCLASRTVEACIQPMNGTLEPTTTSTDAVKGIANVTPVDLTLALCQKSTCAPVRDGVVVWRDTHHITDSYSKSLSPLFTALLKPLVTSASAPTP